MALLEGFFIALGLIMVIGVQNIYVLRYGILGKHVLLLVLTCWLSDVLLMSIGIFSMNSFSEGSTLWTSILSIVGATFLFLYGAGAFYSAIRGKQPLDIDLHQQNTPSAWRVWLTVMAITYLNPHTYIDTVLLIGSVGASYESPQEIYFLIGASVASLLWFACLGFGVKFLKPVFEKPGAWRILEALIGCTMWGMGIKLVLPLFAIVRHHLSSVI